MATMAAILENLYITS